jgi:hypothetical protein
MVQLPVDIDATYADSSADDSVKLHQQHHDAIHAVVNAFDTKADKTALPISVLDPEFGLSGTTDNTAAIQAALDAARGRPVFFPSRGPNVPYVVTLPPGKDYILGVSANQTLYGEGGAVIQVKAGTGDYRSVFAGSTKGTDLSGLTIRNLTIDQNTPNNQVTDSTALFAGYPRYAVYVAVGTGVTIERCTFTNVDSVNTLAIAGATVEDVRIQDNEFRVIGSSMRAHDHSTIYTSAQGQTITGNVFKGVAGGLSARTAIETHGGRQIVSNNRVSDYYCAMNITGVAHAGNSGVIVSNNNVANVMIGIHLWSYAGRNGGLKNCDVSHNVVTLDPYAWKDYPSVSVPAGIMLNPDNSAHVESLKIIGNTIIFARPSAARAGELKAAGLALWHSDSAVEIRNLDIFDNTVIGALSAGLRLAARVRRGKISRNRWVDCGSSTEAAMASFYRSGAVIVGNLADVLIENNETHDTRNPHVIAQGIMSQLDAGTRCYQRDNTVTCTDGAVLPSFVQKGVRCFDTDPAAPVGTRFSRGLYYGPEGGRKAITTVPKSLTAAPFWVSEAQTFDRIGCEITGKGAAGSVVRLGVYADDGSGKPGALVLDAGTVPGDVSGPKEIAIRQTLHAGLYWLVSVGQGGSPQIRCLAATQVLGGAGTSTLAMATASSPRLGYTMAGVSGALPARFSQGGQSPSPGLVVLRAA